MVDGSVALANQHPCHREIGLVLGVGVVRCVLAFVRGLFLMLWCS